MKPSLPITTYIQICIAVVEYWSSCLRIWEKRAIAYTAKAPITGTLNAALILSFCQAAAAQTSIVVARVPDKIVFAADSKGTIDENNSLSVCKIYQSDNFFFAVAGLAEDRDPRSKFNVGSIIYDAIRGRTTIIAKVDAAERAFKVAFKKEVLFLKSQNVRSQDVANYRKVIDPKKGGVTIAFGGFEGTVPLLFVTSFKPTELGRADILITVNRDSCPGPSKFCPNGVGVFYLGEFDAIEKYLATANVSVQPEELVQILVQVEIDSGTPSVGPPIDILRVTKDGAEWIKHKPECEEQKDPQAKPKPPQTKGRGRRK